jgi:hypothetical protein
VLPAVLSDITGRPGCQTIIELLCLAAAFELAAIYFFCYYCTNPGRVFSETAILTPARPVCPALSLGSY